MSVPARPIPAQADTGPDPTDVDNLAAAISLIRLGVPVFVAAPNPIYDPAAPKTITGPDGRPVENPASKEYRLPDDWQRTEADENALAAWRPGYALCAVMTVLNGVDVDSKHGADIAAERARLEALGVRVLAVVETPSGGRHFYVIGVGVCSSSRPAVGVDYRGQGLDGSGTGFLFLPGTRRPAYGGNGYRWLEPLDPAEVEEAGPSTVEEQRDAVAAYLTAVGTTPRFRKRSAPAPVESAADLPEDLAARLSDLGPTWERVDRETGEVRTHADRSARFHYLVGSCYRAGLDLSTTVEVLTPWCHALAKYVGREAEEVTRSWAKVAEDGDQGRGSALARMTSSASGRDSEHAPRVTREEVETQAAQEGWPDPVPVGPTSPGPVNYSGLPDDLRDLIRAQAEAAQAPAEVVLATVLGAAAAATRGAWTVRVHPSWSAGPTCLWFLTLAGSGERKSSGMSPILDPLRAAERALATQVRAENRNREHERKRLARALGDLEKEPDADPAQVARLTEAHHAARPYPVPNLIHDDVTVEALGRHMTEQYGAAAIFSAEVASLRTAAGAYSDSGANLSFFNAAYSGESYGDLRIKRDAIKVERPSLTWAVAVQPAVMAGYARESDTVGSGFLARFALLCPAPRVGSRIMRTPPVPEVLRESWAETLRALHAEGWGAYRTMTRDMPDDLGPAREIRFTEEAADLLLDYLTEVEARLADPRDDLHDMIGWAARHGERLARIAAVLALLERPDRRDVPAWAIRAALSLSPSLIAHAHAAMATLRAATPSGGADSAALSALRRLGTPTVTTREVYRVVRGQTSWVDSAADVERALVDLADLGWLRGPERVTGERGGRPSEVWAVHPAVWAEVSAVEVSAISGEHMANTPETSPVEPSADVDTGGFGHIGPNGRRSVEGLSTNSLSLSRSDFLSTPLTYGQNVQNLERAPGAGVHSCPRERGGPCQVCDLAEVEGDARPAPAEPLDPMAEWSEPVDPWAEVEDPWAEEVAE